MNVVFLIHSLLGVHFLEEDRRQLHKDCQDLRAQNEELKRRLDELSSKNSQVSISLPSITRIISIALSRIYYIIVYIYFVFVMIIIVFLFKFTLFNYCC